MNLKTITENLEDAVSKLKESTSDLGESIDELSGVWDDLVICSQDGDRKGFAKCWNEVAKRICAMSTSHIQQDLEAIEEALS